MLMYSSGNYEKYTTIEEGNKSLDLKILIAFLKYFVFNKKKVLLPASALH